MNEKKHEKDRMMILANGLKRWKFVVAGICGLALLVVGVLSFSTFSHAGASNALALSAQVVGCRGGQGNIVQGQVVAATATSLTVQCAKPGSAFGAYDFVSDGNAPVTITLDNNTGYRLFFGAAVSTQRPDVKLGAKIVSISVTQNEDMTLTAKVVTILSSLHPLHW